MASSGNAKNKRTYQEAWESVKKANGNFIFICLPPTVVSDNVIPSLKRIAKALQKEKYSDVEFRRTNPAAELEFERIPEKATLKVRLTFLYNVSENNEF